MKRLLFFLLPFIVIGLAAMQANAQCPVGSAYYWNTLNPTTLNVPSIITGTWKQNIMYVNVVAGRTYLIGNCTAVSGTNPGAGTSVTIRESGGGAVVGFASGPGAICAQFTAPVTGQYWAYLYKDDCTTESTGFTVGAMWIISCQQPTGVNATGINVNGATISWTGPSTSILGYEYVLSTSSTAPTTAGTPITSTTFNATGLNPNTTYYFYVRTKCNATDFSSWSSVQFKTLNDCIAPVNVKGTATGTSSADVSWDAVPGSIGYEYVINQLPSTPTTAGINTTTNSISLTALNGGTTYYIHLRNKCSSTSISDWVTVPFTMPQCKPSSSIDIINITDYTADLIWSPVNPSREYQYIVNTTRTAPSSGKNAINTNNFIVNLTALMPGTKYYVHLRSLCFTSDSSAWSIDSFVTNAQCSAPDIQIKKTDENLLEAKWTPNNSDYAYEYSVRENIMVPVYGVEISEPKLSLSLPLDNKQYYLHVRRKCDIGANYSPWSSVLLRNIDPTSINKLSSNTVKIYPNPTQSKLVVEINGPIGSDAQISVSDVSGKVLITKQVKSLQTELDIQDYPTGIYLIKYSDDKTSATQKISKL
jgi:hypothetical protein